ncbi:MAG: nucleotidyltransferase family protein [Acidobacteria bacterium]|nr:nucleotidyltransferase family protein [Acidobacteriota bacterium]
MTPRVPVPTAAIADFCRKWQVTEFALFGSVLRDDFRPDSDVDVLVDFEPAHAVGLIGLAALQRELAALIRRNVDLRTPNDRSPCFRDDVMHSAREQYAA